MTFSKEDIEFIMNLIKSNPDSTVETLINTAPVKTPSDIESILKGMSPTALKKQFGTNILPKTRQKSAVNQLKKALKDKINNPPKLLYGKEPKQAQLDKITSVYKTELSLW